MRLDRYSLERLAADGLAAFPPAHLSGLAKWCWDFGEATGDARYSSLSCTVRMLADLFQENSSPLTVRVEAIDHLLQARLPDVLNANEPAEGATLARLLREAVQRAYND